MTDFWTLGNEHPIAGLDPVYVHGSLTTRFNRGLVVKLVASRFQHRRFRVSVVLRDRLQLRLLPTAQGRFERCRQSKCDVFAPRPGDYLNADREAFG